MGKATSPSKKGTSTLSGKAAPNAPHELVRARSFDDSLASERVERAESTIVNRETATHLAFAKRYLSSGSVFATQLDTDMFAIAVVVKMTSRLLRRPNTSVS